MRLTLPLLLPFLLAACGQPATEEPATTAATGNATPADSVPPPPPPADPRRAEVIGAVVKAVGEVDASARTAIGYADIGGDEREEALVYLVDPGQCGSGGCSLVVLTPSGKGWRSVGKTSVTRLPVHRRAWSGTAAGTISRSGSAAAGGHRVSRCSASPAADILPIRRSSRSSTAFPKVRGW